MLGLPSLDQIKQKLTSILKCVWDWFRSPFSSDNGSNWTESFQHFIVAIGIIISGLWAYDTFVVLNQKEQAEASLDKTKSELEKMTLELEQLRTLIDANLSSNITLHTKTVESNSNLGLIVEAKVRNTGSRPITMKWDTSPFSIYEVAYKDGIQASRKEYNPEIYQNLTAGKVRFVSELYLLVGAEKTLSSYIEIKTCGLYLIMYKAQPDSGIIEQSKKANEKDGFWFASKYVHIDKPNFCNKENN